MQSGIAPLKVDHRDYDLHKTFGTVAPPSFPENFDLDAHLWTPDQNIPQDITGLPAIPALPYGCTDYTGSDLCADEDKHLYDPMVLENLTHANALGGLDLRQALKATVSAFSRGAYYSIKAYSPLDWFDAIRVAIWSTQNECRSVSVGTPWFPDFELTQGGILPTPTAFDGARVSWHNWKISGWKTINGQTYLIGKSWQGADYGDHGFHYVSRELINKLLSIPGTGAFTVSKLKPTAIQTIDRSMILKLVSFMQNLIEPWLKHQIFEPTPPSTIPPSPPPQVPHLQASRIPTWGLAIQHQEGGKIHDRNTRNFNPGNLKYTTYTQSLGALTHDTGNFCIFADYRTGFRALCAFLTDACTDQLQSYHSGMTLDQFTTIYAQPPNANYVNGIANSLGVPITYKIRDLL